MAEEKAGELGKLVAKLQDQKKSIETAVRLLRDIQRLDQHLVANLRKVRERVQKLENNLACLDPHDVAKELREWLEAYKRRLEGSERQLGSRFANGLQAELAKEGITLDGHLPHLKASFFTIEVDVSRGKAILWLGPRQERVCECTLSPTEVAKRIVEQRDRLGAGLQGTELLERLDQAYRRVVGTRVGERAPILDVMLEMAFLVQPKRFRSDPRRDNYRTYGRADFSMDLYRARGARSTEALAPKRVELTTATRMYTRSRSTFLWVPEAERADLGHAYSFLAVKEAEA